MPAQPPYMLKENGKVFTVTEDYTAPTMRFESGQTLREQNDGQYQRWDTMDRPIPSQVFSVEEIANLLNDNIIKAV